MTAADRLGFSTLPARGYNALQVSAFDPSAPVSGDSGAVTRLLAYTTDTTGFREYHLFVKDLRTGVTSPTPSDVLDGALDPFMAAALAQRVSGEKVEVEDVD